MENRKGYQLGGAFSPYKQPKESRYKNEKRNGKN